MKDYNRYIKIYIFFIFYFFLTKITIISCENQYKECPLEKPIQNTTSGECFMGYCTKEQFSKLECNITNPIIKTQYLNQFLFMTEESFPIHSSIGTNQEGDVFIEATKGTPYSKKQIFCLKNDGREMIDNILINEINSGNNMNSNTGNGAVVTINGNKCYMKFSSNESLEIFDFISKKNSYANLKEELGGYTIKSEHNSLLRTSTENTFIYAFITEDNYLMMQKFQITSNDAKTAIKTVKTLKEEVKSYPTNRRTCMITVKQYIECLDLNEDLMYVIRIYDSNLKFLGQFELEKNNAPPDRLYNIYHETVLLKGEISIFSYYTDITENGAKPILVLKKLTVKSNKATLSNLNQYLTRDIVFNSINKPFSEKDNSLAIFNEYYFGVTSLSEQDGHQTLYVALANIFNDDKTIDTHYFSISLSLYDIKYHSGLRAFGFKNAYGVQMNYIHNNTPSSGYIVFGYGNTTDPEPVNRLFDKYSSYSINVKDYYQGIDNNLFCYVFMNTFKVAEVPNTSYFTTKAGSTTIKAGSSIKISDVITITKINGKTVPKGTYKLAFAPYLNEADYAGFTSCAVGDDMFGLKCPTNWYPDEYYGRTIEFKFTEGLDCFQNCDTCTEKGESFDDQKCDSCLYGYYFMDGTKNCFGEIPEGYYFNETLKTYSPCYERCKFCTNEKQGNIDNCLICKDEFILDSNSNCIDENNNEDKISQTEAKIEISYEKIINDDIQCYKNCLTCSKEPIYNQRNEILNMNCDLCNEYKGYYLIPGTKNCQNKEDIIYTNGTYCPQDKPILKDGKCVLDTCTKEEIDNNICEVSNPVIKTQYIDDNSLFGSSSVPFQSTFAQIDNNNIIFESNNESPLSERMFYSLNEDGRGLIDKDPDKIIQLNSELYSSEGNAALTNIEGNLIYIRLSNYESFEIYDFKNEKYTSARLEDILGYKVESSKNSLLYTEEGNTFIYTYITTGNKLINTLFRIISNEADTGMEIIKTVLEDFTTIPKNSRRCLLTQNQYLECLELDDNLNYIIQIYNKTLDFLSEYNIDKNKSPLDRAYYTYHEAILLKNETSIFVYYNDISDHDAKPFIILKKLLEKDDTLELIDLSNNYNKIELFISFPYILSDSENSLTKIDSNSFALATLTFNEMSHLLIALGNIYNNDNSIEIKYYDIPLKDLYGINYYNGLQSFGYKSLYGISFNHKKGEEYKTSFIILGYGNSADPEPIKDIFEKNDNYIFNPTELIRLQNNVFCYELKKIIITKIPDESTGIIVQKNDDTKAILKKGDILLLNEEIIITYKGNKNDIQIGDYLIGFTPYLTDAENNNNCYKDTEIFGDKNTENNDIKEYYGRTLYLEFNVGQCYDNCLTCSSVGTNINEQKCDTCKENYYFAENSKNCFEKNTILDGYFYDENEKLFKKCYEGCLTCDSKGISQYNMKCKSCDNGEGYFMFYGTNNCVKMPMPGYYIDQKEKVIKECDKSCATCSSKAIYNDKNEIINCDTCNKDLGFYNKDETPICINKTKEGEYYDESCKCYKKCYKDCLTCSGEAIDKYHMNCLTCDANKGFQFYDKNSNCLNCKAINKKVNFDETECIDDIPDGYYVDDSDSVTVNECHKNCLKCSWGPSDKSENCITCQPGLYLKDGNCVKTYTCPYKFFYQAKIDKNADSKQKICLEKNEICPCALPFYYVTTNECIETCPLELLLAQACKISNIPYGIYTYINIVILYFKRGLINNLNKAFSLTDSFLEILVKITIEQLLNGKLNIVRRLQNNDNYLNNNNISDFYKGSDIDLGQCEIKLREFYKIQDNVPLNVIKLEITKNNTNNANYIQYEIFNPYNRSEKLDLSICEEEKVKINNNIDNSIDLDKLNNIIESSEPKLKEVIFSENSNFYTDFCSHFTSEHGADVLIQDRYLDYNYKNKLCQSNCILREINMTQNMVECLCPPNPGFENSSILSIEKILSEDNNINKNNKNFDNNNKQINDSQDYSNTNIKALKCIKNIFSNEFGKNYIFIILTILLILQITLIYIVFTKKNRENEQKSNPHKKDNIMEIRGSNDKLSNESPPPSSVIIKKSKYNYNYDNNIKNSDEFEQDKKKFYAQKCSFCLSNYWNSVKKREIILSILFEKDNKKLDKIKRVFLSIFALNSFIIINTFFFSEKNIHQIYIDKNKYNFSYQFKFIISSNVIAFISFIFIKHMLYNKNINFLKTNKLCYILSSSIIIFALLFFWIYVGAVTSLYIKAKFHLIINIIICFIFNLLINAIFAFISICITIIGYITNEKKLYKIGQKLDNI